MACNHDIVLFTDFQRESFKIIGELYKEAFTSLGYTTIELQTPQSKADIQKFYKICSGKIIFHNTVGSDFRVIPGCYNIALPVHEWSLYPLQWVPLLNKYDEIWVTTAHVKNLLLVSGVTSPLFIIPPSLATIACKKKTNWQAHKPFRFLSVGAAHFRKGFHLLVLGFLQAFPQQGEAILTIKTSSSCDWRSPRSDIIFNTNAYTRDKILQFYHGFDCYISSSLGEGLGLPVIESILSKLPVAANRWGGHKDLLEHDSCFALPYIEILQPFCSRPEYFSNEQRCAYSSPKEIADIFKKIVQTSSAERKKLATRAYNNLRNKYSSSETLNRINERLIGVTRHE